MDDSEARKRKAMEVPFTSSGVLTTDSDHQDTSVQSGFLSSSTIKKEKYSDLDKENIDPGKDRSSKRYRSVSELRAKLQSCVVNSDAKQSSTANPGQRSRAMPLSSLKQIIDGKWPKATSNFFPEGPLQTALPIRRLKLQPGLVEDKECNNVPKAICRNSKSPANEDLSALNYKGQGIELHRNRGHSFDDETLGSKDEICQIVSSNMNIDIEMTAALSGANEKARPAVEAVSMAPSKDLPCSLDYLTSDGSICLEDEVKSVISLSGPVTHSDTPTAFQCQNAKLNVKSNRSQSFDEEALGSKDGNCQLENLNMWSDVEMEVALSGATEKPRLIVEAASMTPSQDSQTPLDFLTIGGSSCLEDEAKSVISLSATTAFQCQNAKWNLKSNRSHFLDDEDLDSKDGNCQVKNSNMRPSPEMETALSEATENPVPVVETVSRAPSEDLETPLNSVTVGGFICLEDEAKCVISLSGPVRHSDVPTAFQCQNAKSNVKSYRSHFLDDESIGSKNGNHQVESSNMCSSTKMRTALSGATEQPVPVVEAVLRAPSQDVQTPFDSNTVGGSICLEDEAKCLISISGPVGHSDAPTAFQCQNKKLNVKSEAPSHGDTSSDNCRNATSTMIYLQSPVDRSYGPKAASGSICLEDEFRCVGSLSGHRAHSDAPNIANSNFMYYQVASHSNAMKLSSEKSRGLRSSELNSQAPSMLDSLPESIMPKAATDSLCLEDEGRCILSLSGPTDAPTVFLSQNANIDVKKFQIPSHSKRFKSPIKNPSFLPSSEVNNSVVSSMVLQEKSLPKIVGERALSEACSSADGKFSKNGGHLDVKKDKKHCLADDRSRHHKKRWESEQFFWVNGKRYQRLGKIGKGGSSEVYKVIASDCTIYALKRIRLKGRDYCSAYGFYQEIEYLEKLRGKKYIIQLIDYEVTKKGFFQHQASKVGTIEDDIFIYMVLECGDIDLAHMLLEEWNERMSNGREMDENWLRYFWKQMLEAVNTIHELRIVHSDLKPANFLLVKGVLKLIDFGIAKAIQSDTTNILRESQVGTVNYMSPESFMMNEDDEYGQVFKCGRPSDIWSLGCILYQMVYGKTPFSHITKIWAKVKEITNPNHEIPFPPVANPQLIDVLKGCLAWKREDRLRIPELLQHPFLLCNPRSLPNHKKKQVEAAVPEVA